MYKGVARFEGQEKEDDDSTGLRTKIAVEAVSRKSRAPLMRPINARDADYTSPAREKMDNGGAAKLPHFH
jgi:hypothetical protein